MLVPRKGVKILVGATFGFLLTILVRQSLRGGSWGSTQSRSQLSEDDVQGTTSTEENVDVSTFRPGIPPPPGHNYSKVLVMAKLRDDDTTWVNESKYSQETAIYVADDPTAALHPPINKGNEVMTYLTYIIDHYQNLPEIMLFMHAHRSTWHNNEILNTDAVEMINRLSSERVVREGYMNLRCHWRPGCPDWIHPGSRETDEDKLEEVELANVWHELFPNDDLPKILAHPCCSQFALSRERALAIPRSKYIFYRDWLIKTDLDDFISGRVWEYIWQFVFAAQTSLCPDQHACYCDGYGVCFENNEAFDYWFELKWRERGLRLELEDWETRTKFINEVSEAGIDEAAMIDIPPLGKDTQIKQEMHKINEQTDTMRDEAIRRGNNPRVRAAIAGRPWSPGDGF